MFEDNLSEDLSLFEILKKLIDINNQYPPEKQQFICYNNYNIETNTVYGIKLNDDNRLDRLDTSENMNKLFLTGIKWLNDNLWKNFIIHGDLTDNNIIIQDSKIYFIDWVDTAKNIPPNYCGFIYILIDIIDYINDFYDYLYI